MIKPGTWLAKLNGMVTKTELNLLERAQETLIGNLAVSDKDTPAPFPWYPLRGIRPSAVGYKGIWNWDAAFHALSISRWDPDLAREQVQIFMNAQLESGALPDVLFMNGDIVTAFGKPPVFPWAMMEIDRRDTNDEFLSRVYECFTRYELFWMRERGGNSEGLFHYDSATQDKDRRSTEAKYESGWDTSVRFDHAIYDLWAIDLNCYMVLLYKAMAYFAKRLGKDAGMQTWKNRAQTLSNAINAELWDKASRCYFDRRRLHGPFTGILTPASFMPLFAGIAPQDRANRMADLAADPQKLFPGMPTVSYDHPAYSSNDYWRGPTWLNTAYFAVQGLINYGHFKTANSIRNVILDWCAKNEDAIYEYYDSHSGKGCGMPHFGWSAAFIIEFILNWKKTGCRTG